MPGVTEEYSYDGEGKLSERTESVNGEDITYTYSYKDTAGRELESTSVDGNSFSYNTNNRLAQYNFTDIEYKKIC